MQISPTRPMRESCLCVTTIFLEWPIRVCHRVTEELALILSVTTSSGCIFRSRDGLPSILLVMSVYNLRSPSSGSLSGSSSVDSAGRHSVASGKIFGEGVWEDSVCQKLTSFE